MSRSGPVLRRGEPNELADVAAVDVVLLQVVHGSEVGVLGLLDFRPGCGHADLDAVAAHRAPLQVHQPVGIHAPLEDRDHLVGQAGTGVVAGGLIPHEFRLRPHEGVLGRLLFIRRDGRGELGLQVGLRRLQPLDLRLVGADGEDQAVPAAKVDAFAQAVGEQGPQAQGDQDRKGSELQGKVLGVHFLSRRPRALDAAYLNV